MFNLLKQITTYFKKDNNKAPINRELLIVVDIGCRWGFADKFLSDMENIFVYGFDPDIEECERLRNLYNNDHIQLIPIGLTDKPSNKTLYITNEPACSSLYKPNKKLTENYPALDCAREVSQIEVKLSTLDIWAKEVGVNYIDYIKIDTQGAELNILKGAADILSTVRFIEVEVEFNPIYEGQPLFSEVDLFLRKYGFVLWKLSNLVHYGKKDESEITMPNDAINYDHHRQEFQVRGGQIYWADAFYIQKEIIDTNYQDKQVEQIKRDFEMAARLGFMDLKYRLEQEYQSRVVV